MGRLGPRTLTGATLDAGALIVFERGDRGVEVLIAQARARRTLLCVPAAVLAQAWRDGQRPARLARLLASPMCEVVPLDATRARKAGRLCVITGTDDVIDASVVVVARERGQRVVTSDAADLSRLDPTFALVVI